VPIGHPLRSILPVADAALAALSGEFQQLYAANGPPSIAPEKLFRALLLQAFYSVRSEWQRWPAEGRGRRP
jgi:transposase